MQLLDYHYFSQNKIRHINRLDSEFDPTKNNPKIFNPAIF